MVGQSLGHDGLFRLSTALSREEYEAFTEIVDRNNVTVSAYLRAMIVDVIAEETKPMDQPA